MVKELYLNSIYKYYSQVLTQENSNEEALRLEMISAKIPSLDHKVLRGVFDIAHEYAVVDWTDIEACCYELKILLHKNQENLDDDLMLIEALGSIRYDLRLFVSILAPYYYMFIEETRYSKSTSTWRFNTIDAFNKEQNNLRDKIINYLSQNDYIQLSTLDVKRVVPGIQTELKELNEATIFDCLFTDIVTIK